MIHCRHCGADFANRNTLEIHFGVGAPAFHACWNTKEMTAKGMIQDSAGVWTIDDSLLVHENVYGRVALKSNVAKLEDWQEGGQPQWRSK